MARFKNFTLEGSALNITAYLTPEGKTAYTIELHSEFDSEGLTFEQLVRFRKAIKEDTAWACTVYDGALDDFEDTWKEEEEECSTDEQ